MSFSYKKTCHNQLAFIQIFGFAFFKKNKNNCFFTLTHLEEYKSIAFCDLLWKTQKCAIFLRFLLYQSDINMILKLQKLSNTLIEQEFI